MAEPDGTADVEDDTLPDEEELTGEEDGEEGDDGEAESAEPPRRRRVSELLEGEDAVGEAPRDLQLVATPIHIEPVESGQAVYQLDLSGGEPEGTLLEPDPVEGDRESAPAAGAAFTAPSPVTTASDARSAVRELVSQRDRMVMAAERDGIGAYELASGIDAFVDAVVASVRHYDAEPEE